MDSMIRAAETCGGFVWQTEDDRPTATLEAVRSLMAAAQGPRDSARAAPDCDLPPDTPMANQADFIDAARA